MVSCTWARHRDQVFYQNSNIRTIFPARVCGELREIRTEIIKTTNRSRDILPQPSRRDRDSVSFAKLIYYFLLYFSTFRLNETVARTKNHRVRGPAIYFFQRNIVCCLIHFFLHFKIFATFFDILTWQKRITISHPRGVVIEQMSLRVTVRSGSSNCNTYIATLLTADCDILPFVSSIFRTASRNE